MKVKKYARFLLLLCWLPALFLLQACPDPLEKEEQAKIKDDPDYQAKVFLRDQCMEVFYYWRDEVMARNKTIKPYNYDIYAYFDELL